MNELDRLFQQWENFFMPKIEYDANGNIICTIQTVATAPWTHTTGYKFPSRDVHSFLRAICDKSGKVLSYANAKKLFPDPYYSNFHLGCWYVFEEYRPELMKNFKIHTFGTPWDEVGATWEYDADMRLYALHDQRSWPHWFKIEGNHITTDYGEYETKTYPHNVIQQQPNKDVLDSVQYELKVAKVVPEQQSKWQQLQNWLRRKSH